MLERRLRLALLSQVVLSTQQHSLVFYFGRNFSFSRIGKPGSNEEWAHGGLYRVSCLESGSFKARCCLSLWLSLFSKDYIYKLRASDVWFRTFALSSFQVTGLGVCLPIHRASGAPIMIQMERWKPWDALSKISLQSSWHGAPGFGLQTDFVWPAQNTQQEPRRQ